MKRSNGALTPATALAFALTLILSASVVAGGASGGQMPLFGLDTVEEVAKFDNDNTGARLLFTQEVVKEGGGALAITPNGSAPETKLGVEIPAGKLGEWSKYDVVRLHVYIPETMKTTPNTFFLGMADLSKEWEWVDGVFTEKAVKPGWNEIAYVLCDAMKNVKSSGRYKLYFSFFRANESKEKVALAETFYVDAITLSTLDATALPPIALSGEFSAAWTVEYQRALVGYDNDWTGAVFEIDQAMTYDDKCSVAVIPSGSSAETKLALDLAGDALQEWIGKSELVLNMYLPPENEHNPNWFFLGMADITDGWNWVDGTFATGQAVPGWNQITYPLTDAMKNLNPARKYKVYFSWFHQNTPDPKIPLHEKFYIIPPFESHPAPQNYMRLALNLTFNQGSSTVAYLPLTLTLTGDEPTMGVGNWYFSHNTEPVAFWISNNDKDNVKKFASLGDPLGIAATLGRGLVINARGKVFGAEANLYSAGLSASSAFLGRVTYGLPLGFELGAVGAYTSEQGATGKNDLVFGVDVTGNVPGTDADLTLAGAGYWKKTGAWKFDAPENNLACLVQLEGLGVGPATFAAKYVQVGLGFRSAYASTDNAALLNAYKGAAAVEAEAELALPVGVPSTLTLANALRMKQADHSPMWNRTTAEVVVDPTPDLKVTVSGAYVSDLDKNVATDFAGFEVHADSVYSKFGLNFKPFADYKTGNCADSAEHDGKRADTIVGLNIKGSTSHGVTLETEAKYTVEDPATELFGYGHYAVDAPSGLLKGARFDVAGVGSYTKKGVGIGITDYYAFAGAKANVTDALYSRAAVLTKDEKGGLVVGLDLDWKVSDRIGAYLVYTFRNKGIKPPADPNMWRPFDDGGKNWLKASVVGTIGTGTITLSYGADGRKAADTSNFHAGKPWAYLRNYPGNYMDWQLFTVSVKVPF